MMKQLLFTLFFVTAVAAKAQQNQPIIECATELTPEQAQYLKETRVQRRQFAAQKSSGIPIFIPVQHHVVRKSDGSGGITRADLDKIMVELNHYYAPVDLIFFECNSEHYIDNTAYFDFSSSQEGTLGAANDVPNTLNIYYFNSVLSGGSPVCGYSRFPPSSDRAIMDNSCAVNGSTIVHEVGHYFSLFHTHGKSNNGTTDELVNGSNCNFAGDDICDTPADPNLNGVVNTICGYTGTGLDVNGDPFNPQTNNIMSYSRKQCRQLLTVGQLDRVLASVNLDRNYLVCPSPPAPTADFEASTALSCDGVVQFWDRSASLPTVWNWNFGDGATSNIRNPLHYYTANGNYTVTLTTSNANGSDVETKTSFVAVNMPPGPNLGVVDSVCKGQGTTLFGGGGSTTYWYDSQNATVPVAIGNTFSTPKLFANTNYYASSDYPNAVLHLGPVTNTIGSTFTPMTYEYLEFNALKPFVLKSVKVYAKGAGVRTIELRDNYGLLIQAITVSIPDGLQTVALNFNVPFGNQLQLGTSVVSKVDMYANLTGASYPYSISGLVSITGNSGGSGNYYYFYDWEVQQNNCKSARVEVVVPVKECVSGLSEIEKLSAIQIMPNPTNARFTVVNNYIEDLQITVFSLVGNQVMQINLKKGRNNVDISGLENGVYLLRCEHEGAVIMKKLVKN